MTLMKKPTLVACSLLLFAFAPANAAVKYQTGDVFSKAVALEGIDTTQAMACAMEGTRLYVGGDYLAVFETKDDPLHPKLLGQTKEMAKVRQVAVQDGIAYVVARENGVWIVDCRDPARPKTLSQFTTPSNCTGVDAAGPVCFIGGSGAGLEILDVSDLAHPQQIAAFKQDPMESQSVAYRDGILYSSEWGGKCVSIWDVRDLADIKRLAIAPIASCGDGAWPSGRWLYAPTGWLISDKEKGTEPHPGQMGLEIFDIADPAAPKRTARLDFDYVGATGLDMWIARSCGDMVFVAANAGGLYAVDATDKTAPKILDRWVEPGVTGAAAKKKLATTRPSVCVGSLAIGDGVVYVTGPKQGVWAVPAKGAKIEPVKRGKPPANYTTRPARPEVPAGFHRWLPADTNLTANVTGLAVKGDTFYAACGPAGLYALGLSAGGIKELKRFPLGTCTDAAVAGNRLFVAAGREGFIGYEIVSPTELREFMRLPSYTARDVYAYGDGTRWVSFNTTVYDISNPAEPKSLVGLVHQARWNKFMCPDLIAGRWVSGNTAGKYFAWADLMADTVEEQKIAGYKSKTGAMCAFGDKGFIADNGKWAIVEPGCTDAPTMKSFPKGGGVKSGLPRASGSKVAISGAGSSVSVWDFSNPANPKLSRTYSFGSKSDAISFWGERIVIPARTAGVLMPQSL